MYYGKCILGDNKIIWIWIWIWALAVKSRVSMLLFPRNLTNEKSTMVQVMACCLTASSHYLNQCWSSRVMSLYGVTRPQWVNTRGWMGEYISHITNEWRYNERDGVSNHQFTQPFILAQIKENIKAPRHWPFWWRQHEKLRCIHSSCVDLIRMMSAR